MDGLGNDPFAEAVFGFSGHDLDDLELMRQRFFNPKIDPCAVAFEIGSSRLFDMNSRKPCAQGFAVVCHPPSRPLIDEELSHGHVKGGKINFLDTPRYPWLILS